MGPVTAAMIMILSMSATLNPDGSGKAAIEISMSLPSPPGPDGKPGEPSPQDLRSFADNIFKYNRNAVDVWADVSVSGKPGLGVFKGTAYFKDLSRLAFPNNPTGLRMKWAKDPRGGMLLELAVSGSGEPPTKPADIPADELAKRVADAQAAWKTDMQPKMENRITGSKVTFAFTLPGAAETSGFKKAADGSLSLAFDGAEVVKGMARLMSDAKYVAECIKTDLRPALDIRDPIMTELMFGSKGPFTARVAGETKPQFDYDAEVKAAKEALPKMMEKLGLDKAPDK
jgi:hypothetical protein